MLNRTELKKQVPRGSATTIAQKAGVTTKTVSEYLNGKNNNIKVELAVLEVLAELNKKKKELLAQIAN